MIKKIIGYSVRNKLIIALFIIAWTGWGLWSLTQLSIDAVPDITDNQVRVITTSPTLATQEVEQFVTYPVELAMANLPGVKEIRSVSKMGLSVVTIVFRDDMGTYKPRQLVSEQLKKAEKEIPSEFGSPELAPITTGLGEIYQYSLVVEDEYRDKYNITELRTIQDWIIRRQLTGIDGVVEINSTGGKVKQYEVAVNPEVLRSMDLTVSEVLDALKRNNGNTGGSYVEKGPEALFIRGEGLAENTDDIRKIVVETRNGTPVLIGDIAEVGFGHAVRFGAMTRNGEGESVGGQVLMLKGQNSDEVIENVKKRINEIQPSLPEGVNIVPFIDRTKLIGNTTSTVTENLVLGALIVVFFLVLLLGNIRSGLIVASVIPLSMLFAIGLMNTFGISANLMSLGALDFGIIVDGAVIIVEFTAYLITSSRAELSSIRGSKLSRRIDEIAEDAGSRMMSSAFFGQLIILIVFVPIITLTGVEGKMFRPMAFTFGFAIIGAILLCLTYVPAASAYFLKSGKSGEIQISRRIMDILTYRLYHPVIVSALRHKGFVITSTLLMLVASLVIFARMGGEFIPQLDEGDLAIHPITKPGTSLSRVIQNNTELERILLKEFPEVKQVVSRIGTAEIPTDPMSLEMSDLFIILKDKDEWVSANSREELIEKIRSKLSEMPGVDFTFSQPIEMRFNELMTGIREDIAVKIYGDDLETLAGLGRQARNIINDIQGISDINLEQTVGLPQLRVRYKRNRMARYGVDVENVNTLIRSAYAGGKAGVIYEGERRFDLVIRLDGDYRNDLDSIRNLYAETFDGEHIPLSEIADISYTEGPAQISRDNTRRRIVIGVNAGESDIQSIVERIRHKLDSEMQLPAGYNISFGGEFENLERAKSRLAFAVPLSLALIFIMLYFALKSLRHSLLVFTAIPLATIGGVLSLWLREMPFSISAGVGFIVLFGIAVLNGIILMSFFNELRDAGIKDINRRILMGTRQRLRPVLLTAATDLFGFLPMAVSTAAGAEVQRPLATVVIGGLVSSTMLTLLVLPVLYSMMEEPGRKLNFTLTGAIPALVVLLLITAPAAAQDVYNADPPLRISEEKAVEMALEKTPEMHAAKLEAERAEALKGTAFDLPPTRFSVSREEAGNGRSGVESIGIQQEMDFPLKYFKRSNAAEINSDIARTQQAITRIELERQVRLAWQNWRYNAEVVRLYKRQAEILGDLPRAAKLSYEEGEIDNLEKLRTESVYKEALAKLNSAKTDLSVDERKLRNLLLTDLPLAPESDDYTPVEPPQDFKPQVSAHPLLEEKHNMVELSEAETEVDRADYWPGMYVGYKHQRINDRDGFYAMEIGLRIPLWFGATRDRVIAGEIKENIAQSELESVRLKINTGYHEALETWKNRKIQYELQLERLQGLGKELQRTAERRYQEGDIDYTTYTNNMQQAIEIEKNWLDSLLKLNESVVELNYYLKNTSGRQK